MQTLSNKFQKITTDSRYDNKASRTGFTILAFFSKEL